MAPSPRLWQPPVWLCLLWAQCVQMELSACRAPSQFMFRGSVGRTPRCAGHPIASQSPIGDTRAACTLWQGSAMLP